MTRMNALPDPAEVAEHMTDTQITTLQLAARCESLASIDDAYSADTYQKAAAELRRLHDANDRLGRDTLRIVDALQARIDELETALQQAVDAMQDFDYDKRVHAIATARQTLGSAA